MSSFGWGSKEISKAKALFGGKWPKFQVMETDEGPVIGFYQRVDSAPHAITWMLVGGWVAYMTGTDDVLHETGEFTFPHYLSLESAEEAYRDWGSEYDEEYEDE